MILISHRGNIEGKNLELENKPSYIQKAIQLGFNVEIDVWFNNKFMLGHDKPEYDFSFDLISNFHTKLWLHCKNIEALTQFNLIDPLGSQLNYFWHEKDTVTLTSKNYIWAYPGKQPIKNSIAVMPELNNDNLSQCVGVCSDYIQNYK